MKLWFILLKKLPKWTWWFGPKMAIKYLRVVRSSMDFMPHQFERLTWKWDELAEQYADDGLAEEGKFLKAFKEDAEKIYHSLHK
jgi:hypothetical protein